MRLRSETKNKRVKPIETKMRLENFKIFIQLTDSLNMSGTKRCGSIEMNNVK